MSFWSKFLPKRKPPEIKNNIPKEKENIKQSFAVYCHANHGTEGSKLCSKCNALLLTVMTKIDRCPYGITKPICDRCDRPCFGANATKDFLAIMEKTRTKMFLRHPIMTVKHKIAGWGVDYAKVKQEQKAANKEKAAKKKNAGKKKK